MISFHQFNEAIQPKYFTAAFGAHATKITEDDAIFHLKQPVVKFIYDYLEHKGLAVGNPLSFTADYPKECLDKTLASSDAPQAVIPPVEKISSKILATKLGAECLIVEVGEESEARITFLVGPALNLVKKFIQKTGAINTATRRKVTDEEANEYFIDIEDGIICIVNNYVKSFNPKKQDGFVKLGEKVSPAITWDLQIDSSLAEKKRLPISFMPIYLQFLEPGKPKLVAFLPEDMDKAITKLNNILTTLPPGDPNKNYVEDLLEMAQTAKRKKVIFYIRPKFI